jgi:hypothetical protein
MIESPETQHAPEQSVTRAFLGVMVALLLVPLLLIGAVLAFPARFVWGWVRQHREHTFRMLMKSRGRLIPWQEFLRSMHSSGGTCIEERFSPKGPVRFWWTAEDVYAESPHEIIDWFTMRKGRKAEPFILWCRARYTEANGGSATLVDTGLVARRDIYALWSECRSDTSIARWVEVAPPEIVPHKLGE